MPMLAPTQRGWFRSVDRALTRTRKTAQVFVVHPEIVALVTYEEGERIHVRASTTEEDVVYDQLRSLSDGGYFEIRPEDGSPRYGDAVVVCADPGQRRNHACTPEQLTQMVGALGANRYYEAMVSYARNCVGCPVRTACQSARLMQKNLPRLAHLTGPGTEAFEAATQPEEEPELERAV